MDEEGKGIVKIRGQEIHIPYLIDGETAIVEVTEKRNFISAKVIRIEEKSKDRVVPKCKYFDQCGGCQLQHLSYEGQSKFKWNSVVKLMKKYDKVNEVLTMSEPYFYRNKVHSTVAYDKKKRIISGIYEEHTHAIVNGNIS